MAKATAEGKDILMDFTGSDWCGWCIRLNDEVFRHRQFADYASAHQLSIVLVVFAFTVLFSMFLLNRKALRR